MATTQIEFCQASPDLQTIYANGAVVESKTPSSSNQATTAVSRKDHNVVCVATDTLVYVSFGASPNAGSDTIRFLCPAGSVRFFRLNAADIKAAIITP